MNLHFKEMMLEDIEFFISIRNECSDNLHDNSKFSIEESKKWFLQNKPLYYIIFLDDQKIGYFRTSLLCLKNKNIYIGADLHKDFRGKGLAKKAYIKFINFIFQKYNLNKINLEVLSTNNIALNLYKSLGFKIDGIKRKEIFRNNEFIDSIIMSLLKEEWNFEK